MLANFQMKYVLNISRKAPKALDSIFQKVERVACTTQLATIWLCVFASVCGIRFYTH